MSECSAGPHTLAEARQFACCEETVMCRVDVWDQGVSHLERLFQILE